MTGVIVIGGGSIGCHVADRLAAAGVDVEVLERDRIAGGSTGLSVGVVESQYTDPLWIELRVLARRVFDELEAEAGIGFVRSGYLRLGFTDDDLAAFRASAGHQRELGVTDARVLDPGEMRALAPALRVDDVAGGLWSPSDGYVDPHLATVAVLERARRAGARVTERCAVTAAERRGGVWRLETTQGPRTADVVVNAAGPWAPAVSALLGLDSDVVPQRRSAVQAHLAAPLGYVHPFVMNYLPGAGRLGAYVRHEAADRLILGLHAEDVLDPPADPEAFPGGVPVEVLEEIAEQVADRFPGLADGLALGEGWSGLYPSRPSMEPFVGWRREAEGVIEAVGFGGSGIQAGPAAGVLVRDWLLHDAPVSVPAAARLAG
ncbi:MAG: NAD(P)/FAD-dependent oxidoreductase [Gaiellales bacterium]